MPILLDECLSVRGLDVCEPELVELDEAAAREVSTTRWSSVGYTRVGG